MLRDSWTSEDSVVRGSGWVLDFFRPRRKSAAVAITAVIKNVN